MPCYMFLEKKYILRLFQKPPNLQKQKSILTLVHLSEGQLLVLLVTTFRLLASSKLSPSQLNWLEGQTVVQEVEGLSPGWTNTQGLNITKDFSAISRNGQTFQSSLIRTNKPQVPSPAFINNLVRQGTLKNPLMRLL